MNHIQISVKFDEDTHHELAQVAGKMRITPHKFIVTAVQDMQSMIKNRGKEKLPLLVVQARAALDYERESLPLPMRTEGVLSEKPPETRDSEQPRSASRVRTKLCSPRAA